MNWPSFGETMPERVFCWLLLLSMILVPICWVIGRSGALFVAKSIACSVVFVIYLVCLWVAFVVVLVTGALVSPFILIQNHIGPKAEKWLNQN